MSQEVMTTIIAIAEYYGRQLSENVLKMYASDLADLDPHAVCAGYTQYRRNPANRAFPLPAQIRELVAPEQYVAVETQAREIAQRIVGGITKFGWCNGKQAELSIGPEGWALVQRMGGWGHLCETTSHKQTTFLTAQLRDQLEGTLRYGSHAIEQAIGIGASEERSQLSAPSHSEMVRAILSRMPPEDSGPKEGA